MTVGGVWLQPEFTQHGFTDYELTTLVGPEVQRKGYYYSAPGGTQWAMSSTTAHPEEAWQWLNWLYSPAAGKPIATVNLGRTQADDLRSQGYRAVIVVDRLMMNGYSNSHSLSK